MSFTKVVLAALVLSIAGCRLGTQGEVAEQIGEGRLADPEIYLPDVALGDLFHEVQMKRVFTDSKTFVDCVPLSPPAEVLKAYHSSRNLEAFDLSDFVKSYFKIPQQRVITVQTDDKQMADHLNQHWNYLTRLPDTLSERSSLLPLPYSYVVPGGRFREIYYWDSYFTMLGLFSSKRNDLAKDMIKNFAYLIDTYGFIPNGNRSYYLGRSQPPFFSAMVMLLAEQEGMDAAKPFLNHMEKEHQFWMEGSQLLTGGRRDYKRVVRLADNVILNRYWDNFEKPRPESYLEDFELARALNDERKKVLYRNLRAGAESGFDYSSRWFSDAASFDSIVTTQIIPVDLNALLYHMETAIATLNYEIGNSHKGDQFQQNATQRKDAILQYCWDESTGIFLDYNYKRGRRTQIPSLACMYPLYFRIANPTQAAKTADFVQQNLLYPGGVVTTLNATGQQWDFPNGWAPLQWITIKGLRNYQKNKLADEISNRWVALVDKIFKNTGKMMEKYNVVDLSLEAGGGEYPTQDGFGWTNGVTLKLLENKK